MNGYQFMGEHPFLTVILAFFVVGLLELPFRLVNRWIRHRDIVARGWPPEHLDADGDWPPRRIEFEEDEDQDA